MGRKPSGPWWRASHGAYYVTHNGRQIRLDADPEIARARFLALTQTVGPLTVAGLVRAWLAAKAGEVSLHTLRLYRQHAESFAAVAGEMAAEDVQPRHLTAWLSGRNVGPNTQTIAKRVVKVLWSWAVQEGHIPTNPLARVKNGTMGRRAHIPEDQMSKWLSCITVPELALWCEVALGTGLRPGEQAGLSWPDVDVAARTAIVRGKTGNRTVYLSGAVLDRLRGLAERRPVGPLLRTPRGVPWTVDNLDDYFQQTSAASGVRVVPHQLRAQFGSRLHARGVDILTISKLLGHSSVAMTAKHYVTVDTTSLLGALDKG